MATLVLGNSGYVGNRVKLGIKGQVYTGGRKGDVSFDVLRDDYKDKLIEFIKRYNINCIVNCIALANLDYCEENKAECYIVNYCFARDLAGICKEHQVFLVHISSNAVYDGENAPYNEDSDMNPINFYGETKKLADVYITSNLDDFCVLRPITMYGAVNDGERPNPVSFCIENMKKGHPLKLVDDNIVNYLHVDNFVEAVNVVVNEKINGTFNLAGDISLSRYDLGCKISSTCGFEIDNLSKVSGATFPVVAKRPRDTSFDNSKMKSVLNIKPKDFEAELLSICNSI
jgi:dTDP-4-dehydrorhamnose reductase